MANNKHSLNRLEYSILKRLFFIENTYASKGGNILLNLQVSGGMDSMCLFHAFVKVYFSKFFITKNKFIIVVQHFNHRMRGVESDDDATLVAKTCLEKGIPVYLENKQENQLLQGNFQNDARKWRKEKAILLCEKLAKNFDCNKYFIVTGHHARDHVETVLLHMLRGCSLNGLIGIQEFDDLNIYYRPFYNTEYEKLEKYCLEESITYRVDSSNLKDDYERNYIRNNILPHFKKLKSTYQRSFQILSCQALEQMHVNLCSKDVQKSENFFIWKGITASVLYKILVTKEQKLFQVLTRNSVENILHEISILIESGMMEKEIKLSYGWVVKLVKGNNNIEIDVSQQKNKE